MSDALIEGLWQLTECREELAAGAILFPRELARLVETDFRVS
jgi:hypothetical protein